MNAYYIELYFPPDDKRCVRHIMAKTQREAEAEAVRPYGTTIPLIVGVTVYVPKPAKIRRYLYSGHQLTDLYIDGMAVVREGALCYYHNTGTYVARCKAVQRTDEPNVFHCLIYHDDHDVEFVPCTKTPARKS